MLAEVTKSSASPLLTEPPTCLEGTEAEDVEGSRKTMATFSAEAELVAAPAVLAAHKRAVGETKDKASDDGAASYQKRHW